MSCENHTGCDFGCGACSWQDAIKYEKHRIITSMLDYLELTRFSEESEGATKNEEWTAGFNAAIAIAKGETK